MLEFIVLGEIPGTSIRISFNWVLIITASLLIGLELYRILKRKRKTLVEESVSLKKANA